MMDLNHNWDILAEHVYIINLVRRSDRRKLMEYKLNKVGLSNYEFFDAIDGYDKQYDRLYKKVNKVNNNFNSRGALGLILTYVKLLEDAYQKNYSSIIILEDDVNIHKNYKSLLALFNNVITKRHYDIIWLGANQPKISNKQIDDIKKKNRYRPEPHKGNYTYGTYSMIITLNGIEKLRQHINNNNIMNLRPIDNFINDLMIDGVICGTVCYPYIFIPDVSDSDNMPVRDQDEFASIRGINMEDYDYVSQNDINVLRDFIKAQLTVSPDRTINDVLNDVMNGILDNAYVKQALAQIRNCITDHNEIRKLIQ